MNQDGLSVKRLTEEQSWLQTGALLVLAIVAFSFALALARVVLIPFTMALFLNYLVAPVVDFQMVRLKFSRFLSVTIALLLVVLVLFLLSLLFLVVIQNVTQANTDTEFATRLQERLEGPLSYAFDVLEWATGIEDTEADAAGTDLQNRSVEDEAPPLLQDDERTNGSPPGDLSPLIAPAIFQESEREESPDEEGPAEESPTSEPAAATDEDTDSAADITPLPGEPADTDDDTEDSGPEVPTGTVLTDDPSDEEGLDEEEEPATIVVEPAADEALQGFRSERQIPRTRQFINWIQRELQAELQRLGPGSVQQFGGTVVSVLSSVLLTAIFVGFMLAGRNPYKISKGIYAEIDRKVRRYITTKFFISAVTGVLVWLTLEIIGLRFASMFGLMAFCLNFIPSVGSIISTILPIPIALVEFDSLFWIALVILIPGTIQMVIGNVIEPKIMGDGLQLHPVTILLGLAFFAMLWGPVGMLLAAPITATIRIVMMRFHTTVPIGNLMAGILPEEHDDADHPEGQEANSPEAYS